MALKPSISVCLNNKCDVLTLTDTTGLYAAITNPTGWGSPNEDTDKLQSAYVYVYDSTGNLIHTYDVLSQIINPAIDDMPLGTQSWQNNDGVYSFVYSVESAADGTIYTSDTVTEFFYCRLLNCIEEEKLKIVSTCDLVKLEKIKNNIDTLEIFLYGAKSAFACGNFAQVATIMETASALCTQLDNCGCGC